MLKILLPGAALAAAAASLAAESWTVTSPNGQVVLTAQLADLGGQADYPRAKRLYYRLEWGAEGNRTTVIGDSPLGLRLRQQDLVDGLRFDSARPLRLIEEAYELPHGKRRACRNQGRELSLAFRNAANLPLELDLRAYDNGAAFRYRIPGTGGLETLEAEESGFALPAGSRVWMAPSDEATMYKPAYETYYESGIPAGTAAPLGHGWSFPALLRTPSGPWALVTEAGLDAHFCATRLRSVASGGVYRIGLPLAAEGNSQGAVQPSAPLPWTMPWRVIAVGAGLGAIVESTLVTDVSPPCRLADTGWIKPGRVAWSWWSDPPSPQDGAKQKKFVDLAASMGWEYLLIDANWDIMDHGNVHDVLRYAQERGVGVLLWYNSGGPHNIVTEKPRDTLTSQPVRRFELELLRKWGVKGIKVDFFQSDKQDVISLYHGLLQDAADFQIMLNFHGCTLPRGWERTWPHLMSMEAVRGAECYIFDPEYPQRAPVQNTILPFTRNAVGPMDFTPVAFSDNTYPHRTTAAHELALTVVFESAWLHFADKAEAYLGLPPVPQEFLKRVPVTWEETRFLDGMPGQFVALARRQGDTWYVGAINGQEQALRLSLATQGWLPGGRYEVARIGDGADARSFDSQTQLLEAAAPLEVSLAPRGGFVATLRRLP